MTITDHDLIHGPDPRRIDACCVFELLLHDGVTDLVYDGNFTVTAGAVTVTFTYHEVSIAFVDPWCDMDDCCVVTLTPTCATYGAIAEIVHGLAIRLAVAE